MKCGEKKHRKKNLNYVTLTQSISIEGLLFNLLENFT